MLIVLDAIANKPLIPPLQTDRDSILQQLCFEWIQQVILGTTCSPEGRLDCQRRPSW